MAIVLKENEKDVAVYHIKDNGELDLMKSKIKDGKVIFEINHFSKFAIVSNTPKQNNGNSDNTSNNKQATPTVQNNQPTQTAPLNSSVASSINNSKLGKHLAKTGLSNNNLASLAAIGLVLSGALILGRRKNKR